MRNRRTARERRTVLVPLVVVLLLVVGVAGGLWWWRAQESKNARAASAYAVAVARAIGAGSLPPGVEVGDRAAAQRDLDRVLEGMGSLEHRVTVGAVELGEGEDEGRVVLKHLWTIHEDKGPWTYETTMPVTRSGEAWRGEWSPAVVVAGLADDERIRAVREDPVRADVLGDGDTPLVRKRPVVRLGIDRAKVPEQAAATRSARRLAEIVDVDPKVYAARVAGAGPEAFVEAITYRADVRELAEASSAMTRVPGAVQVRGELPLAPTSTFARPILGTSGLATAEIIEQSGGRVRVGDLVGLSGLQSTHDESLAGVAGYTVEAVDRDTDESRPLHAVPAQDGQPLRVTLSRAHQMAAEEVLEALEPASAVVAIRPSDGHVLAAASGPGSKGYSTATLGQYAPGSTFKAVSALALLRAGLTPESAVDCPATLVVDGRQFKNFDDYPSSRLGRIPLRTAFANSCNTALMRERGRLGPSSLPDAAAALGLTVEPALGVPAALGSVPPPETDIETAASMIGQSRVLSTPLGMATVAASISKGAPVTPVLVTGNDARTPTPAGPGLTNDERAHLLDMLRAVVTDGGATLLNDVPGAPVSAKTGTAEFGQPDESGTLATHAWMIAVQDDLAVAIFVERGSGGSTVAGPVMRDFLDSVHDTP